MQKLGSRLLAQSRGLPCPLGHGAHAVVLVTVTPSRFALVLVIVLVLVLVLVRVGTESDGEAMMFLSPQSGVRGTRSLLDFVGFAAWAVLVGG